MKLLSLECFVVAAQTLDTTHIRQEKNIVRKPRQSHTDPMNTDGNDSNRSHGHLLVWKNLNKGAGPVTGCHRVWKLEGLHLTDLSS